MSACPSSLGEASRVHARGCCLRLIGWAGGDTDLRSMGFEGEKQIAEVENTQEGKKKENSLA